jgi:hypothetical protein
MSRQWPAKVVYLPDLDRGSILYENGLEQVIQFQHGPTGDGVGINGVMNEEVIGLLLVRLRALNERFPCRENSLAITKLEEGLFWLEHRQDLRVEQGVYGKNEAHTS